MKALKGAWSLRRVKTAPVAAVVRRARAARWEMSRFRSTREAPRAREARRRGKKKRPATSLSLPVRAAGRIPAPLRTWSLRARTATAASGGEAGDGGQREGAAEVRGPGGAGDAAHGVGGTRGQR
jgi:hypothetical protein